VDIRTKLVFALVSVALGSMLALGVMMFGSVERELRQQTMDRLEGLAQFKVDALEGIVSGWHDRVALVASRTQLRQSLAEHLRTGADAPVASMERILADAVGASPRFRALRVYDPEGGVVASAGVGSGGAAPRVEFADPEAELGVRYEGVSFVPDAPPVVVFTAPLTLDGALIGWLHAVLGVEEVLDLSSNYEGLGETGETMVVVRESNGARVLHPVRFVDGDPAADDAALLALDNAEYSFAGGLTDYRGEEVWVATRYLPETGWGVLVKIDEEEQVLPIEAFRADTVRLAVTLAAFAIVLGTLIGFRVARPLLALSDAAGRIEGGDLTARSGVSREDEVGLLARTFDDMAASLEEKVGLLTEFRTFFDVSLDMMCIAATDGYLKRVNPAFVRELGWSEEQLLDRSFLSFVHPDDVDATLRELEQLMAGNPTIRFENRFRCSDGSYKLLHWTSYPEPGTGRLYAIARVGGADAPEAV
jgi:PAS domain S-box-containing protein